MSYGRFIGFRGIKGGDTDTLVQNGCVDPLMWPCGASLADELLLRLLTIAYCLLLCHVHNSTKQTCAPGIYRGSWPWCNQRHMNQNLLFGTILVYYEKAGSWYHWNFGISYNQWHWNIEQNDIIQYSYTNNMDPTYKTNPWAPLCFSCGTTKSVAGHFGPMLRKWNWPIYSRQSIVCSQCIERKSLMWLSMSAKLFTGSFRAGDHLALPFNTFYFRWIAFEWG